MFQSLKSPCFFLLLVGLLMGCNSSSSPNKDKAATQETLSITLQPQLIAYHRQSLSHGHSIQFPTALTQHRDVEAHLRAINLNTDDEYTQKHSFILNEESLELTSSESMNWAPGSYEITLLMEIEQKAYIAIHQEQISTAASIELELFPVIGEPPSHIDQAKLLASVDIEYAESTMKEDQFPQVGILANDHTEEIFTLKEATRLPKVYMAVEESVDDLQFRLYRGPIQWGEAQVSIASSTSSTSSAPQHHQAQARLLTSQVNLELDVGSNETTFFILLDQVIGNFNQPEDLQTLILIAGEGIAAQIQFQSPILLNGQYYAVATFTGVRFTNLLLLIQFRDLGNSGRTVATCFQWFEINSLNTLQTCTFEINHFSVFGQNFLSSLGVNVFDSQGVPVKDAIVTLNRVPIGLTGMDASTTEGYLKHNILSGEHVIRVEKGNLYGSATVNLLPLQNHNEHIVIEPR